jgi:hypothetical protein
MGARVRTAKSCTTIGFELRSVLPATASAHGTSAHALLCNTPPRRGRLMSAAKKVWHARREASTAQLAAKLSRFPGTPSIALVRPG